MPVPHVSEATAGHDANGVAVREVDSISSTFGSNPEAGITEFGAVVTWESGFRTAASIGSHASIAGDEPRNLAGTGTGPAPEDLLLAAAAQCLVVGIVGTCSARGIAISSLSVTARGSANLAAAYGHGEGHPGFTSVDLDVALNADRTHAELADIVALALRRAPIPSTIQNPVPVSARLS